MITLKMKYVTFTNDQQQTKNGTRFNNSIKKRYQNKIYKITDTFNNTQQKNLLPNRK